MRISDWSSDVCSSDLEEDRPRPATDRPPRPRQAQEALHRYMSIVAAGLIFLCTPTLVADGDGPVWCADGPRIRLAGIAARALDGTCRRRPPCPRAGPTAARNALVALPGGPRGAVRIARESVVSGKSG